MKFVAIEAFQITCPRFAVATVLNSKPDSCVSLLAVLCSTWVGMNKGTSGRSYLLPMGDGTSQAAESGNFMVSRRMGEN